MTFGAVALIASIAAGGAPSAPPGAVLLDVELGTELQALDATALNDALARGLEDREAWRLLALRDVRAMLSLEREKELLGACHGESCLAALGNGLEAPWVVLASLRRSGEGLVATGRILNRATGAVAAQVTEADAGDPRVLLGKLGGAVRVAWRRARGLAPERAGAACGSSAECDAACRGGDGPACVGLGDALAPGDPARAGAAWARACQLGVGDACLRAAGALDASGFPGVAVPAYRAACSRGSAAACGRAGELLVRGGGEPATGIALLTSACGSGEGEACLNLGTFLSEGAGGVAPDPLRARAPLTAACDGGKAGGCARLAAVQLTGDRPQRDGAVARLRRSCAHAGPARGAATAEAFGRVACGAGREDACVELGLDVLVRPSDAELAAALLGRGCAGRAEACRARAARALGGEKRGRPAALRLAEIACGAGSAPACREALRALERESAPVDGQRRVDLLASACEHGDVEGCQEAGRLLEADREAPTALARAARLDERGCTLGSARCCLRLAQLYHDRRVPPPDPGAARRFRTRACQAGLFEACLTDTSW
jgi:hypothetical protein